MIQDYRLLGYNLPHNLEETVQNYIKQGYQPYGNPFVDGDHYYQAVVKYQQDTIITAEQEEQAFKELLDANI